MTDGFGNELQVGDRIVFAQFTDYDEYTMFYGIVTALDRFTITAKAWRAGVEYGKPEMEVRHPWYMDVIKVGEQYNLWGFPEKNFNGSLADEETA